MIATGNGTAAVDFYWLPLGAGGHFVRLNGRVFEAVTARLQRRPVCDLYHSALQVHLGADTYVIEQAPVPDLVGERRGVVAEGAVGPASPAAFASAVTRSASGAAAISRISRRPWIALGGSAMTRGAPAICSTSSPRYRRRSGAATSSEPGRCGIRIRSPRGSSRAPDLMPPRSSRRRADGRPDGTPASSSLGAPPTLERRARRHRARPPAIVDAVGARGQAAAATRSRNSRSSFCSRIVRGRQPPGSRT